MTDTRAAAKRMPRDRDGLHKRRGYWHFYYSDPHSGKWLSKSTGTKTYNEAGRFKRQFLELLKGQYDPKNDRLSFHEASRMYMQHRQISASAGTLRLESERLRALARVLDQIGGADLRLRDITVKVVRRYQQARMREGVGPRTVNMEGQLLRSILKHHE